MFNENDKLVAYHPTIWKHFLRIVDANPENSAAIQAKEIILSRANNSVKPIGIYYSNKNLMYLIGRLIVNHSPVDRLGRFNWLNVGYSPIPTDISGFNKTFETVCFETANKLWESSQNISILWSGGIDSTCAAVSLIQTKPEGKQLRLIGTINSINEYPAFYESHKDIIQIVDQSNLFSIDKLYNNGTTYLTGELGDQLFGGGISYDFSKKDVPWKNVLENLADPFRVLTMSANVPPFLIENFKSKETRDFAIRGIEEMCSRAPFEIKTYLDYSWWLTFVTKYNYCTYKIQKLIADRNIDDMSLYETSPSALLPFYLADDFQRWSMTNHDLKMPGGEETYKQPAKDVISNYTKDVDFIRTKSKVESTKENFDLAWYKKWVVDQTTNYALNSPGVFYNKKFDMSPEQVLHYVNVPKNMRRFDLG